MKACFCAALALAGLGGLADAATFTVRAAAGGCELVDSNATGATVTCANANPVSTVNAVATAAPGVLSVLAGNTAVVGPGLPGNRLLGAQAIASFNDTLFFDGLETGTFEVPVDFLGIVSVSNTSPGHPNATTAEISGGANGVTVNARETAVFQVSVGPVFTSTGSDDVLETAVIEIVGGMAQLFGGLRADARCGDFAFTGLTETCAAISDFSASLRLLGGTVRDETGAVRTDVAVTSESGFDYLAGVAPHRRITVIPVPGALIFGATGILALFAARRQWQMVA